MTKFEEELEKLANPEIYYGNYANCYTSKESIINHFKDWEPPKKKVMIPRFVADYIEEAKSYGKGWWRLLEDDKSDNREVYDWWEDCHETNYVRAWLDGYELEEEKLYNVIFQETAEGNFIALNKRKFQNGNIYGHSGKFNHSKKYDFINGWELTEKEIKAIDERYWAFRVPVEEKVNE